MTIKNPYKQGGMFEGASHLLFENAKHLRNNMTTAEVILWMHLRNKIGGCKFRRQHPIGIYIADFYCHKAKLIIEVDGSVHLEEKVKEADEIRQNDLQKWGYQVIRFTNQEVIGKPEIVIELIKNKISELLNFQNQNEST